MNLNILEVFKPNGTKVRLGKPNDGGYVIVNNGTMYDCFLACGISDDISFEEDFLEKHKGVPCYAFDGTLGQKFPESKQGINFVNKNIGPTNGTDPVSGIGYTNLHEYIAEYRNIFVKMDIEGHEFPWLASLSTDQLRKIKQFVVEFHYPMHHEKHWKMLEKLKETHWLVHLHPHNGCGYQTYQVSNEQGTVGSVVIPNLIECTYVAKEYLEPNKDPIPSPLDQSNSPQCPEKQLTGYPYN
jgi:hypothetical protein